MMSPSLRQTSLFGFPVIGESRMDLSDEDGINLEQAVHEWRLARDFGGDDAGARMAEWARRWAEPLLASVGGLEVARLHAEIDRLEDELDAAEAAPAVTGDAFDALDGVDEGIGDALGVLGERPLTSDHAERAVENLKDAREELGRARRELEKL